MTTDKQIESIAWNKKPITAQQIVDAVTKSINKAYQEKDK